MEFATIPFAYFFLIVLTGTWLLRGHRRARNAFLLVASYYFAWKFHAHFLVVLAVSTVVNHQIAGAIARSARRGRTAWLAFGIAFDVGVLAYFKYWNFFVVTVDSFAAWLGCSPHLQVLQHIAPLGLSFYTFQAIAYLVDTYSGTAVRASLLDFALFQAFFPKFAAGPIVRSSELLPQIQSAPLDSVRAAPHAVTLIFAGLLKKMVLGTYLATHMVEDAFHAPTSASALELWIAVFAYSAQIYLDFSGYTDIARGTAMLIGFELPENFRYPYAATSIGDYWRRWHLTFSRWLRDYVYFPLGGSRGSRWRTYVNLVVTFAVCGLWHGPTWGFVMWGVVHGVLLALAKARRDHARAVGVDPDAPRSPLARVPGWVLTLTAVALARVFFKSDHLDQAWHYFAGLAGDNEPGAGIGIEWGVVAVTALTFAMNLAGRRWFDAAVQWHERIPRIAWPAAWAAVAIALFTLRPYDVSFTIYFSF
jgi:D-alanyl-lipoteichoic acid acyltransferase DltB (MBOAT superfamily)